eukprot:jgi/Botrbrau1/5450/Bobra.27_1s0003.1
MYDFCLTFPYAAILALGGVSGYAAKGSSASLIAGLASSGILAVCGHFSYQSYQQGRLNKPSTAVSLVVAVALTAVMGARWSRTHKFMPPGLISVLSALMAAFYVWNLAALKGPIKGK